MIKFFRNIRKNLIAEGKTARYFKYAIGEIILVVIGILIALYLNNLNETFASKTKTDIILEDVLNELNVNIAKIENEIDFFHKKDSVFWAIKQNRVTKETYADPKHPEFLDMTTLFTQFQLTNDAYQLLIANRENLPLEYKPVLNSLNDLDSKLKADLDLFDNELMQTIKTNIKFYSDNFSWFSDDTETGNENYYNYMLEDFGYKNKVYFLNSLAIRNHFGSALAYRTKAIDNYAKIAMLLDKTGTTPSFTFTNSQLLSFKGQYETLANPLNDSLIKSLGLSKQFKIYEENERLFSKSEGDSTGIEVIPFSKNQIVSRSREFFTLSVKDKDTILETNSKITYKKLLTYD
jgi:hypothetical protein